MANKNDNKSMFLYTALIFIVAVLLIIFSFLGQTNMQKNQPQVSESPDKEMSISEKASILSEENTVLLENNSNLKKENQELSEENIQLKSDNESLTQKQSQNDLLLVQTVILHSVIIQWHLKRLIKLITTIFQVTKKLYTITLKII